MNAGTLDKYVSLRRLDTTLDEIGGVVETWTHVAYAWARWLPTAGREFISAQNRVAAAVGMLRLRYRTDVDETWRVVVEGKAYEVGAPPINAGLRREATDLVLTSVPRNEPMWPLTNIFEVALKKDATSVHVTFPAEFEGAPDGLYVQLVTPSGQPSFTYEISNLDASGFDVTFGAAVPTTGFKLSVQAFQYQMTFTVDLTEGEAQQDITFSTAFPSAPRGLKATLLAPVDGFDFTSAMTANSLTASGFTLEYGATVPGPGYKALIQVSL